MQNDTQQLGFQVDNLQEESWRKNFEELKVKYEELQDLFVETDDELNIYRGRFVDEALQNSSLKLDYDLLRKDMTTVLHRLSVLETLIAK